MRSILALLAAVAGASAQLTVTPPAGPIVGHYSGPSTTVREFLGIPYAKPPVGPLRFAAPQPASAWSTPFAAERHGNSCYNTGFAGAEKLNVPFELPFPAREDEDCLTLNIWSSPTGTKKAVMVWIHGGGFTLGTSDNPLYNGTALVSKNADVIVVSFNYRLNVFGYPGLTPTLPATQQNPGLLDVRAAIEWVSKNIASFGGDPTRITLFGESAGAAATDAYLYSSRAQPLIHGAILQSGTADLPVRDPLGHGQAAHATNWARLGAAINCTETDLPCFRGVPAAALRAAVIAANLTFNPSTDGGTLFADTDDRLRSGVFARVPLLAGSNDQEAIGAPNVTAQVFTCPQARSAKFHARFQPATWQYRYFGNFPIAQGVPALGSFHGSEISSVFGNLPLGAPAEQVASSEYIMKAWVAFAKDPKWGLVKMGWPVFGSERKSLVRLTYGNVPGMTTDWPENWQKGCY